MHEPSMFQYISTSLSFTLRLKREVNNLPVCTEIIKINNDVIDLITNLITIIHFQFQSC